MGSPNREKAMKESKLAILLLCLGCFLPIDKVHGDCARYVLFNSWSLSNKNGEDHYYKGVYKKTLQTSRGRPVWRRKSPTWQTKSKYFCMWIATGAHWWVGPCKEVGRSSGLVYREKRTRCPHDRKYFGDQVKHVEHQAVEKLRCGDEEGVMKSYVGRMHPNIQKSRFCLSEVEQSGFERLNAPTFSVISEAPCLK